MSHFLSASRFGQALPGLATLLSDAARSWEDEGSLEDTLNAIALSGVEMVPGAEYAGVSLVRPPSGIITPAATDDLVRAVDAVAQTLAEGPCVEALWEKRIVRVDDLGTDQRWPAFGSKAVGVGVVSMLAFRLVIGGDAWGALSLYSRQANAFDAASELVGQLLASHTSIALAGLQEVMSLTRQMTGREAVGRATGVMMERHRITAEAAHDMLLATAKASRMSLVDVAAWLTSVRPDSPVETDTSG
jgi:GAF domain-containing protein